MEGTQILTGKTGESQFFHLLAMHLKELGTLLGTFLKLSDLQFLSALRHTISVTVGQDSKKLGKFLSKWNRETETRKLHKAELFGQLTSSWGITRTYLP